MHIHTPQDEIFYVTEGAYKFQVGEDKYDLTTGDSIFLPRQVAHAWTQVSEKGKMTVIMQPAGGFAAAAKPLTKANCRKMSAPTHNMVIDW